MGFLIFSVKNAFRGKLRFILTLILLIIGITALSSSIGAFYFSEDLLQSSAGDNGGMNLAINSNSTKSNNTFSLGELDKIKSTNGVKAAVGASAFPIFTGDYKNYEKIGQFTWGNIYAFTGESLSNNSDVPGIGHIKVIEGRLPTEGTQEVLLTKTFAENMGLKVGDNMNVTAINFDYPENADKYLLDPIKSKFPVVGIINDLPSAEGIIDLNVANKLSYNSSTSKFNYIYIRADSNHINQTKTILSQYSPYYDVEIENKSNSEANDLFMHMVLLLMGVGTLIMIITSLKSISERKREIGVLKSIGWNNKRFMVMILIETVTQALIAWAIALIILLTFTALESDLGLLTFFQTNISTVIYFLIVTLLLSLLMPAIGSIIPLIHVTRLKPTEALRYEQ